MIGAFKKVNVVSRVFVHQLPIGKGMEYDSETAPASTAGTVIIVKPPPSTLTSVSLTDQTPLHANALVFLGLSGSEGRIRGSGESS
jgi:hypothetical protein